MNLKGKKLPAILPNVPEVGVSQAAKTLGYGVRRVRQLCEEGFFTTAHQVTGKGGHWKIARFEVVEKKFVKPIEDKYARA